MAVENKYVSANVTAGKLENSAQSGIGNGFCAVATFEVAAADDDGSVYRVFKGVPSEYIPTKIWVFNDAITAGTVYTLGLYQTDLGPVVDADALSTTLDMSSAAAIGAPKNGLSALNIDQIGQPLWDLAAGVTNLTKKGSYDIAFTASTVGSAAGTISIVAWFTQG
jgi:hypothetical protein